MSPRLTFAALVVFLATLALGAATAAAVSPVVTVENASSVEYTTAVVKGTVNPQGEATTYKFQYATQADFSDAQTGVEGNLPASAVGPQALTGEITDLTAHTIYHLRLLATNVDGTSEEIAASSFETKSATPPHIDQTFPQGVTTSEATLEANINPRGAATTYHFQYLTEAAFQANGFEGASESPPTPLEGKANPDDLAQAPLGGLQPDTRYRFRVVAQSAKGIATGTVTWLHTYAIPPTGSQGCPNEAIRVEQHSTYLPDCRAYEQVSPPDKNGGDIIAYTGVTRAAADGEAVSFSSLTAFGDAQGTGVSSEYLSRRGPSEWTTHSIDPVVGPSSLELLLSPATTHYDGEFSPDLNRGIIFAARPVTDSPAVAGGANLYLRDDLLTAGPGSYQLLTACAICEAEETELPSYAEDSTIDQPFLPGLTGASPDLQVITFESVDKLTQEAPPQSPSCTHERGASEPPSAQYCMPRLYEWDAGSLRLAGILPDGQPADASEAGVLGTDVRNRAPHVVSNGSDGHRRVFFVQPANAAGQTVSQMAPLEAHNVAYNPVQSGYLFVRVDGTSTVQLNRSERSACLPEPEPQSCKEEFAPATYFDASANGERVFLMTKQALTEGAPVNGKPKIYMYDTTAPAGHHLTLISPSGQAYGVIGASEDGHYVYMVVEVAAGVTSIYLWHDGQVSQIAPANALVIGELLGNSSFREFEGDRQARVSPDGRHLVFASTDPVGPTGYAQGHCRVHGNSSPEASCREIYLYSAETERLQCVSCNPSGAPVDVPGDGGFQELNMASIYQIKLGAIPQTAHFGRALSSDGRYVFFDSVEGLVPEDTNGKIDAYEFDTQTEQVHLLSSGTSPDDSYVLEAGEDGRDVFILTRQRLVGSDADSAYDLYDVRIGGGFPEPPPAHSICEGETCQGSVTQPTPAAGVGSTLEGSGNPKPLRCRKGTHAVAFHGRTRCLKNRRRPKHKQRRARPDRRGVK